MRNTLPIAFVLFAAMVVTANPSASSSEKREDRHAPFIEDKQQVSTALSAIFDDSLLQDNVIAIHKTAAALSAQDRFRFLADWVLPSNARTAIRLKGKFNPVLSRHRGLTEDVELVAGRTLKNVAFLDSLGSMTCPALSLLESAKQTGQLDFLRDRIAAVQAVEVNDLRRRAAMIFIIESARDDIAAASIAFNELIALSDQASRDTTEARWPELLALWVGIPNPKTRKLVGEYFFTVYANLDPYVVDAELDVMNDYVRALSGLNKYLETNPDAGDSFGASQPSDQFAAFSYSDAETRGHGRPLTHWQLENGEASKLSGHELDYLAVRSPLQGNYEVECDCSTGNSMNAAFMVAGMHVEIVNESSLRHGSFQKRFSSSELPLPLTKFHDTIRHRAVVRDGVLTHYINGAQVLQEILPPNNDPWTAIRSWRRSNTRIRSFRITGSPTIPDEINLTGNPDLGGWIQYFGEDFGSTRVRWLPLKESDDTVGMFARRVVEQQDEIVEELIRYARPMLEDGTIEYEFFFERGQFSVHPALHRMCFLLQPEGVRLHWLTDGKFDETGLEPDNMFDEPDCRRGPGMLPLIDENWNKVRLTLTGQILALHLNSVLIYERKIDLTNSLNFGFFHFADQTSAKVRNVTWRGDWPKQLPSVAEQQLARSDADFLDETAPKLAAVFHHDFREGFPTELFDVIGDETAIYQVDGGIRSSRVADAGIHEIRACLQIHGDYDIVATFTDLKLQTPAPAGKAGIGLMTFLDNLTQDSSALYRRGGDNGGQQRIHFAHKAVQEDGNIKYSGQGLMEESLSGQLRLARRGDMVYGLYAEHDSPNFRFLFQQQVPPDDVAPQGLRLVMQSERKLPVEVTWCDLDIRAERITGLPIEDSEPIVAALNERRATRTGMMINFADAVSVDENFSMYDGSELFRKHEPDGMRITVPGGGLKDAAIFFGRFGVGPEFDVETQLKMHDIDPPDQLSKPNEILLELHLNNALEPDVSDPVKASLIIRQKSNGIRKLIARLVTKDRTDQFRYVPLRAIEIDSPDKLRIAVLNQTVYFLYSTDDSEADQVIAEYPIDPSIQVTSIALWAFTHSQGRVTDLTWQKLTAEGKTE